MKNSEHKSLEDVFGPVVASYSRAQAIEDSVLIDVTAMAREAGFKWPVALTHTAWCDCVAWTERNNRFQVHQDESGRLWDVLFMAFYAIRTATAPGDRLLFSLYRVPKDGHSTEAGEVSLKLMVGPGDAGEPVVTIMLPNED
ncbi:MAG: hypothetical protein CME43_04395 [Haliea sp.]|jgi:hypothetical protein|uniref:DUF6573 family protein n=1 Tax=Haliea sp. TaxID=1932666 RepID=UPI000C5A02C3|nr:DUF6573 family protein [Haliea sp.]MBM68697.1 hypothetical protein [Haliea sp.]|tara:strand:+ start:5896 stop:6321 length:426 start_codon:yes stop_codon:yes gene_type:complete